MNQDELVWAAQKGDYDTIIESRNLIKSGSAEISVDGEDSNGWTPLTAAASNGQRVIVFYLLLDAVGAKVDHPNSKKDTPLHCAVINSHVQIVKVLLGRNADPNILNGNGLTALDLAKEKIINMQGTGKMHEICLALENSNAKRASELKRPVSGPAQQPEP